MLSSKMVSQQSTDARHACHSRSGGRQLREVPSQVTAECCHQRWFLSAQRVQGMLVIAEATDVKRVRGKRVYSSKNDKEQNNKNPASAV